MIGDERRRPAAAARLDVTWACSRCDAWFSSSDELRRHVATAHDRVTWECSRCAAWFSSSDELRRHVATAHQASSPRPQTIVVNEPPETRSEVEAPPQETTAPDRSSFAPGDDPAHKPRRAPGRRRRAKRSTAQVNHRAGSRGINKRARVHVRPARSTTCPRLRGTSIHSPRGPPDASRPSQNTCLDPSLSGRGHMTCVS